MPRNVAGLHEHVVVGGGGGDPVPAGYADAGDRPFRQSRVVRRRQPCADIVKFRCFVPVVCVQ